MQLHTRPSGCPHGIITARVCALCNPPKPAEPAAPRAVRMPTNYGGRGKRKAGRRQQGGTR